MNVRTAALGAGVAVLLALGASGCTSIDEPYDVDGPLVQGTEETDPPDDVVVDASATTAELVVGQTLVVDFGEINTSVGDEWVLTQDPDDEVLSQGEAESEVLGDGAPGSPSTFLYAFEAREAGTSTIDFEYRFRGAADFGHGPSPVSITVTVTDD